MEMIMSTSHSNAASQWAGPAKTPDWTARLGKIVRATVEALDTGRAALHDYRKLAVHGLAPQEAARVVQQRHFSRRP
jgi:hypothetical protein